MAATPPCRKSHQNKTKNVETAAKNKFLTAVVAALCSDAAAEKNMSNSDKNSQLVRELAEPRCVE